MLGEPVDALKEQAVAAGLDPDYLDKEFPDYPQIAPEIKSDLAISLHRLDDALQELPEQDDQIDTLLRRRLRSDTPDRNELRRASDYLYRRGFGRDEIRAAIARYQDNYEEY